MKTYALIVITIFLISSFIACSPMNPNQQTSPFTTFKITPSPEVLADCFLNFDLSAWIDSNGNSLWDPSEPSLEGVEFRMNGFFASVLSEVPCLSDQDGRCTIRTWAPGECLPGDFTITAVPPSSYQPTTPVSITLSFTTLDFSSEVQFGFRAVAN